MAIQTISGCKVYVHGYDRSGDFNKVNLDYSADELESTTVEAVSNFRSFIAGLRAVKFDGEVFTSHGVGEVETVSDANFAVADKIISIYPANAAGTPGYAFESVEISESPAMIIGDIARFTIKASQSGGLLMRVTDMEGLATKNSTGTGTVTLMGATSAVQTLYSILHVIAVSGTGGPTLTVTVKSDDAVGFTTPVTKLTHTAMTAIGAELKSLAGPITDTYYRVDWTISGTTPSFTFDVGVGIL